MMKIVPVVALVILAACGSDIKVRSDKPTPIVLHCTPDAPGLASLTCVQVSP